MKRYSIALILFLLLIGTASATVFDAYAVANASDGYVSHDGAGDSFGAYRAAGGTVADFSTTTTYIVFGTNDVGYVQWSRGASCLNTTLPAGYTPTAATFSWLATSSGDTGLGDLWIGVTPFSPASKSALAYTDYNTFSDTQLAGYIKATKSARNNWTFNAAGLASINTSGTSCYMLRYDPDIINNGGNISYAIGAYTYQQFNDNDAGGASREFLEITASISAPVASFSKNLTQGWNSLPVQFTDTSTGSPTQRNWSFGDGTWDNSTGTPVTHTYTTAGTYSAYLIASSTGGSNQSASQTITVYQHEPIPNFTRYATVITADQPWEGIVVGEPDVIYDTNPQILNTSTHVYKMWYAGNWTHPRVGYAESTNGYNFTKYSTYTNLPEGDRSTPFKDGSTYYCYIANPANTQIDLYNSTDGITWQQDTLNVIPLGAGGADWDHSHVANTAVWNASGVWNVLYEASNSGNNVYYIGLANGSSPRSLTKYSGNPIIGAPAGGTASNGGPNTYIFNGSVHSILVHASPSSTLPTDLYKVDSFTPTSWTYNPTVAILNRTGTDEGQGQSVGQISDPSVVQRIGTFYLYYSATPDGATGNSGSTIKLATSNGLSNDFVPVSSITNLTNSTTCSSINWNWTNPTDANYNGVMIYQNGVFQYNLTPSFTNDFWSSLSMNTLYNFSSMTFDTNGITNGTFVNMSAQTLNCTVLANFTSNVTSVCINNNVQFNDTSTGYPDTWAWDFGDTGTSTNQNDTHAYGSAGLYTVALTASNAFASNTSTKYNYINATTCIIPTTSFTTNTTCGTSNVSVQFTDTSSGGVTYYWNFGDGNTSTAKNPAYKYVFVGQFNVSHSATNTFGTTWSNKTNLITVTFANTSCGSAVCNYGNYSKFFNSNDIAHYNTSYLIANQPVNRTTEYVWIIFALLGIGMLIMSTLDVDRVTKDLTSIFASLFLFVSTIQAFSVDTLTGYGVTGLNDNGVHEFVLMENHIIYHYDFLGVTLGICFIVAIANQFRLWLEYRRIEEVSEEEKHEFEPMKGNE